MVVAANNGRSTNFWKDRWISHCPLSITFPDLFSLAFNLEALASEYWRTSQWRLALRHSNLLHVNPLRTLLLEGIMSWVLKPDEQDQHSWRWIGNGVLREILYKFLNSRGCWSGSGKFIWSTKAPYRVNVFLWLVGKEAINTWDNLIVRGWQGPYICSLCGIDVETTVHLFITCEFAWSIWTVVDVSMLSV